MKKFTPDNQPSSGLGAPGAVLGGERSGQRPGPSTAQALLLPVGPEVLASCGVSHSSGTLSPPLQLLPQQPREEVVSPPCPTWHQLWIPNNGGFEAGSRCLS